MHPYVQELHEAQPRVSLYIKDAPAWRHAEIWGRLLLARLPYAADATGLHKGCQDNIDQQLPNNCAWNLPCWYKATTLLLLCTTYQSLPSSIASTVTKCTWPC